MKIGIIGTHAIGKTTLVYDLASSLKKQDFNAGILTEVSRNSPFPINEETTKEAQKWILFTQYLKEIEKEKKYEYLICDRSLIDNYAYYVNKFGKSRELEPFILEHMKTYDFLFKLPINKKYLTEDGIRSINEKFQKAIDVLVDELLKEHEIPYYNYSSLEESIKIILGEK